MQAITIISTPVRNEFAVERIAYLTVAKYAGLVVGSSVWPMTADFIGRRLAFNITLLLSSVAGLVGAGSPNFVAVATFSAFIGAAPVATSLWTAPSSSSSSLLHTSIS
jgi:MFS family permease